MASVEADSYWFGASVVFTDTDIATGSATWRFSTPTLADTITWNSGPNEADGTIFPALAPHRIEQKFGTPLGPLAGGAPIARTYVGFARTDTVRSIASCSGSGFGTILPAILTTTVYRANWTVTATGVRATPGSFTARANADDPITISKQQLADLGVTGDRFSLLLPVGVEELHHTASGRAGFGVSYRTSEGEVRLVELASGGGGVEVTGDGANFLRIYRVRDYLDNPVAFGDEPLSFDKLRSALERTIENGVLSAPLRMQIILVDVPIPTIEIADGGVVAMFRVGTNASESEEDAGGKSYPQYPVSEKAHSD
jgi:hypothetical protein